MRLFDGGPGGRGREWKYYVCLRGGTRHGLRTSKGEGAACCTRDSGAGSPCVVCRTGKALALLHPSNQAINRHTHSLSPSQPLPILTTARMVEVRELVAATKDQTPGQELQPKEVIATNAQIREHMRQLNEDYKELERLFLKEKNKRKVD